MSNQWMLWTAVVTSLKLMMKKRKVEGNTLHLTTAASVVVPDVK